MAISRTTIVCGIYVLSLAACTPLQEGGQRATFNVKNTVQNAAFVMQDILTYRPKKPQPKPVPPAYCYRVLQDIVCEGEPQPSAERRLVAYQGPLPHKEVAAVSMPESSIHSSYDAKPAEVRPMPVPLVTAEPAPPTSASSLPKEEQRERTAKSMQRFLNSKPVFIDEPPPVQEQEPPAGSAPN